jgi:hypothetical protein
MKTRTLRLLSLAGLAAAASTFSLLTGCSQQSTDNATSQVKEAYQDTKDAVVSAWDNATTYTFDKRNDFSADARARMAQIDAQVAKLRASNADAQASASRKAALDDLTTSQADFKAKVDALGTATSDTWDSARQNVVSAWDHLRASYDKARAD